MKIYLSIVLLIFVFHLPSHLFGQEVQLAQNKDSVLYPEIGKSLMHITFKNKATTIEPTVDFKGKWVILNFWWVGCIGCINGFPDDNELAQEFNGKVKYILIGEQDPENSVREIFEAANKTYKLNAIQCFYDSTLFRYWEISNVPVIIVINPEGVIKYITNNISKSDFASILSDGHPMLISARKNLGPHLINNNNNKVHRTMAKCEGDTTALYSCIIANYDTSFFLSDFYNIEQMIKMNALIQITGFSLGELYSSAYFGVKAPGEDSNTLGKIFPWTVFEVKDSNYLKVNFPSRGYYSFFLQYRQNTEGNAGRYQKTMISELNSFFRYRSSMEERVLPYYRLIVINRNLVNSHRTKGGDTKIVGSLLDLQYYNAPIEIIRNLYGRNFYKMLPLANETNIKFNVDMNLKGVLTNFKDFKRALNANGLDIVLSRKKMKVVILRDAQ